MPEELSDELARIFEEQGRDSFLRTLTSSTRVGLAKLGVTSASHLEENTADQIRRVVRDPEQFAMIRFNIESRRQSSTA